MEPIKYSLKFRIFIILMHLKTKFSFIKVNDMCWILNLNCWKSKLDHITIQKYAFFGYLSIYKLHYLYLNFIYLFYYI